MRSYRLFVTIFVATLIVTAPLMAQCKMGAAQGAHDCKATCMSGLSEEQIEKMQKLHLSHQQEIVDIEAGIKKVHLKIKEEFMAENPDAKSLKGLADKLAALKGEMHKSKIGMILDAKKIIPTDHWKMFLKNHLNHSHHKCTCGKCGSGGGKGMKDGCKSAKKMGCGSAAAKGCKAEIKCGEAGK